MKRFGLIGKHISYSLSPLIHNAHFESLGINAHYDLIDIDDLAHFELLKGYTGFNITVPYKEAFLPLLDEMSEDVKTIGAVNCVVVVNDKFRGYNTDSYGIYQTLKKYQLDLNKKKVLIIGCGGAGKAVYYTLQKYTEHEVYITNRTTSKALQLTKQVIPFTDLANYSGEFDLIINCVTPDVAIELPKIKPQATIIDINYQKHSIFIPPHMKKHTYFIDGTDMLIYQAAKSFELWFNIAPNVDVMYKELERSSKNAHW